MRRLRRSGSKPSKLILPSVFSWYDLDLHFRLDELMEINFENS